MNSFPCVYLYARFFSCVKWVFLVYVCLYIKILKQLLSKKCFLQWFKWFLNFYFKRKFTFLISHSLNCKTIIIISLSVLSNQLIFKKILGNPFKCQNCAYVLYFSGPKYVIYRVKWGKTALFWIAGLSTLFSCEKQW